MSLTDVRHPLPSDSTPPVRLATELAGLGPAELAASDEAEWMVARLTRASETDDGAEAVRVAAFNSFI